MVVRSLWFFHLVLESSKKKVNNDDGKKDVIISIPIDEFFVNLDFVLNTTTCLH